MTAPTTAAEESLACAINRAAGGRPIPGNHVELLIDGTATYRAMLDVIAHAQRWIHFENYIFRSDAVGWRFADALASRARDGVHVRLLYDWLGSAATSRKIWRHLRDAGVEVRTFHPPRAIDLFTNLSRNHRKLVVADGTRAVLGGLCIGCEWTGESHEGGLPWRDTAVEIAGPASALLDRAFARTWAIAGPPVPDSDVAGRVAPRGDAEIRVIAGEPGRERTYRVVELLAAASVERLWITDAYLVAPPRLFQTLRDAAADGVDVRLLLPGSSDLPVIRNISRIGYRDLLRSGVRIWEWDGPMLHAKTIVTDGRWVRIGSSNLNPSSLLGNYEIDVLIEDRRLADALEMQFRRDISQSRAIAGRPMRGPRRISQVLPVVLTHEEPKAGTETHRRTPRERRRRAAVALRTIATHARRSIFVPVSASLLVLGLLFVTLPTATAYTFAVICVWLAVGAAREAFRRRGGSAAPDHHLPT